MSTRFESANSEYAGRSSVAVGSASTWGGYFYIHSLPSAGNFAPIITVYGSSDGWSVWIDENGKLRIRDDNGAVLSAAGSATLAINTWYYLWVRYDGSAVSVYLNDSTTADIARASFLGGPARVEFATNQSSYTTHYWGDLSLDGWKGWSIDRAASNAATEDDGHALVSSTSAIGAWYLDGTDVTDHSGTGNDLTASGTLSAGPDSPIDATPTPPAIAPKLANALRPTSSRVIGRAALALRAVRPPAASGNVFADTVTDSVTAAETETATADFAVARAETLTAAESSTGAMDAAVARAEVLTAADSQTGALAAAVAVTETLAATDAQTGAMAAAVARAESLSATDSQDATVTGAGEQVVESLTATATQTATVVYAAARAETLSATDTDTATAIVNALLAEVVAAVESATGAWSTSANRAESLTLADAQTGDIPGAFITSAAGLVLVPNDGRLSLAPYDGRLFLVPDDGAISLTPDQ